MTEDRMQVAREALRAWSDRQRELAAEFRRTLAPLIKAARRAQAELISQQAVRLAARHVVAPETAERLIRRLGASDAETCLVEARQRAVGPWDVARDRSPEAPVVQCACPRPTTHPMGPACMICGRQM